MPAICDASACDAKSLAMWIERCEPLRAKPEDLGVLHCSFEPKFYSHLFIRASDLPPNSEMGA